MEVRGHRADHRQGQSCGGERCQPAKGPVKAGSKRPAAPKHLQDAHEPHLPPREVPNPPHILLTRLLFGCDSFTAPAPGNTTARSTWTTHNAMPIPQAVVPPAGLRVRLVYPTRTP